MGLHRVMGFYRVIWVIWGFPKIRGRYHFRGPHNKDYSIWGSILGYPYFGKLLYLLGAIWGLYWAYIGAT